METQEFQKNNAFSRIIGLKCPNCGQSHMFKYKNPYNLNHMLDMNESCDHCGFEYEKEPGFYYGTGYVSYALSVAVTVATFIAFSVFHGISVHNNSIFYWIGINIFTLLLLQPIMMRYSRRIWLAFFYKPASKIVETKIPEKTSLFDFYNE